LRVQVPEISPAVRALEGDNPVGDEGEEVEAEQPATVNVKSARPRRQTVFIRADSEQVARHHETA